MPSETIKYKFVVISCNLHLTRGHYISVEGDYCFARSGMDGLYYRAHIDAVDDNGAMLTFFDETGEHIAFEKIYTQEEAYKAMQCFANWGNKGNYYPAKVIACAEESYTVTYDEMPDMRDTLDQSMVRFAPW